MSDLRKMQLGEILDGTFTIYRRHFALFMKLSMIVMWLPMAVWVYLQVRYTGGNATDLAVVFQDHPVTVFLVLLVMGVVSTAAGMMMKAGSIRVISDSYLGHEPRLGPALGLGAAKIIPLLLVALGKALLLALICIVGAGAVTVMVVVTKFAGTAVAVLAGVAGGVAVVWFVIFVACGYGVTTPAVVLEDLPSSFDSFGRSWDLTRAFKNKVLGLSVVAYLISQFLPQLVVAALTVVILAAAPALQPFLIVLASFLGILLAPVMPCALTLLYYDLRVRREAFDLQILSQQLGIS